MCLREDRRKKKANNDIIMRQTATDDEGFQSNWSIPRSLREEHVIIKVGIP